MLNVKYNFTHVCFIINESGSILNSVITNSRSLAVINAVIAIDTEVKCYTSTINNSFTDETGINLASVIK